MPEPLVEVEGLGELPFEEGPFTFDEDDLLLYALLTDPVYMPEIMWRAPSNREYGGCYRVRDYQYDLNRVTDYLTGEVEHYAIFACARSVGKTESEKIHAEIHPLKSYDNLLITAPELIHLLPLTDAIEENVRDSKLLTEVLEVRGGQTGFTHRPFGVNFIDGTKIVGRIPKKTGTGVKGQHQPFLMLEEGQDYPERGWAEVNETVNYDDPSFRFWIYGVHSGNKASGFDERARSGGYRKFQVTALQRPDWNSVRKQNAVAAYGGSSSPDYRRNILGEPGAGSSAYFVTARVMSIVDQQVERGEQRGSVYNNETYVAQRFRFEEMESLGMDIADMLDLPDGFKRVWGGADIGLTDSPTVISLFAELRYKQAHEKKARDRLALIRRFTLERFRTKEIRKALYTIGWHFGGALAGVGIDITGLGFPIWQEMEDDEIAPPHLIDVTEPYMFNAKVPVGVDPSLVTSHHGVLKDHLGNLVKEIVDEATGEKRYIVMMPFIAASTRFVREYVDSGYLLLPFDTEVTSDMLQETKQRVERIGQAQTSAVKKGDRFHILDTFRAMAMRTKKDEIEAQIREPDQTPVYDLAGSEQATTLADLSGLPPDQLADVLDVIG